MTCWKVNYSWTMEVACAWINLMFPVIACQLPPFDTHSTAQSYLMMMGGKSEAHGFRSVKLGRNKKGSCRRPLPRSWYGLLNHTCGWNPDAKLPTSSNHSTSFLFPFLISQPEIGGRCHHLTVKTPFDDSEVEPFWEENQWLVWQLMSQPMSWLIDRAVSWIKIMYCICYIIIYVYIYIHMYIYIYILYIGIYIYVCVCMNVCMCACMDVSVYDCVYN